MLAGGARAGMPSSHAEQGGILGGLLPSPVSATPAEPGSKAQDGIVGSLLKPPAPEVHLTDEQRFAQVRATYGTHYQCEVVRRRRTRYATAGGALAGILIGAGAHAADGADFGQAAVYGFIGLEAVAGAFLGYRFSPLVAPDCPALAWDADARSPEERYHEADLKFQDCRARRVASIAGWTAGSAVIAGLVTSLAGRAIARTPSGRRTADLIGAGAAVLGGAFIGWPLGSGNAPRCGAAPRPDDFPSGPPAAAPPVTPVMPAPAPSATVNP